MSPAIAPARPAKDRVQGIDASLSDLTLSSGRKLAIEIGGAIQPTPTLTRTIAGSSSISLDLYDPDLALLDVALLAEKFSVELDGLWFRYAATEKAGKVFSLTFEDREIARLREFKGPKKAFRANTTRAEFIVSLLREALPRTSVFCPQLHVKQPIKSKSQGKKAKEEAKENRGKGLGDAKGLTVKGAKATSAQIDMGERAIRVAEHDQASFQVMVALMAACIDESTLTMHAVGSEGAIGLLQVLPSTASSMGIDPHNVEQVVHAFLTEGFTDGIGAIAFANRNPGASAGDIATHCQGNEAEASVYDAVAKEARGWVEAFLGGEGTSTGATSVPVAYTYEVGKKEDYWEAAKRLTKEVNWLIFFVAGRCFLIDEIELSRGMVRLAIHREKGESSPSTPGVIDVDFTYNANRKVTEVTITAVAKQWAVPPGAVVTIAGYGPASIGFGDAPAKANAKGQKQGISAARNAKTGEGRGRYLIETIEGPLRDDKSYARLVTIKARKPTAPLPEPAAGTKTTSAGNGSNGGASTDALAEVTIPHATAGAPWWGGAKPIFQQFVTPFMEQHGLSPGAEKEEGHASGSDHALYSTNAYAVDYPTSSGAQIAKALALAMGSAGWHEDSYTSFAIKVDGYSFEVQILWGAGIEHGDHVHVGMHRS